MVAVTKFWFKQIFDGGTTVRAAAAVLVFALAFGGAGNAQARYASIVIDYDTGLEVGAGVRGYYINSGPSNEDIGAGGVGALVRLVPPVLPKASFSVGFYYCPEILTALDGEGLWDAEFKASFEVAPRATAVVSYTEIEADIEGQGERTLDRTFRVGLTLGF